MEARRLGHTELAPSALGLGSLALVGGHGRIEAGGEAVVRAALEMGFTLLDVAGCPASSAIERMVGRAIAGRRDTVVVAVRPTTSACSAAGTAAAQALGPDRLKVACEASLRRLGTDFIDLYYLHCGDPTVPIEEGVGAMAELVNTGKIRHIGLTDPTEDQLRRAQSIHPITVVSSEYALWNRRAEARILPAAREFGIGFVACRPLGRGYLTGKLFSTDQLRPSDDRFRDPRFRDENLRRNRRLIDAAEKVAALKDVGLARLVLAWLLSRGDDIVPIPSTHSLLHLEMNLAAADMQLTPAECDELAALFPLKAVHGSEG